jgi:hypothetical protein
MGMHSVWDQPGPPPSTRPGTLESLVVAPTLATVLGTLLSIFTFLLPFFLFYCHLSSHQLETEKTSLVSFSSTDIYL